MSNDIPCIDCIVLSICISKVKAHAKYYNNVLRNNILNEEDTLEISIRHLLMSDKCTLLERYIQETNGDAYDFERLMPYLTGRINNV